MRVISRHLTASIVTIFIVCAQRPADADLEPQCSALLTKHKITADDLAADLKANSRFPAPCTSNATFHALYGPDPKPVIPGASDTGEMGCRYGNPSLWSNPGCCGTRPHFNWVLATCEPTDNRTTTNFKFCKNVPECAWRPKINYIATYQFDGEKMVLMNDSSAGDLSDEGVAGSFEDKTGWERVKRNFSWQFGDWTTKYAPWARGEGHAGPRGITPPGGMWVISADSFYYGGWYMLSQLNLNLAGDRRRPGPCWTWELDPAEGTVGWMPDGQSLPGNLNQLYTTDFARSPGCMPVPWTNSQAQGASKTFKYPEMFRDYCDDNPTADGCDFGWGKPTVWWSGGAESTTRFEQYADEAYVFVTVVDASGYWTYRYRTGQNSSTPWPGIGRYKAARQVPKSPAPVTEPRGLRTDVPGDVAEALILQPGSPPEASCTRVGSQVLSDPMNGGEALGSIASEEGDTAKYDGAHNWWTYFSDTGQFDKSYPASIMGRPKPTLSTGTCDSAAHFGCACRANHTTPPPAPAPNASACEPGGSVWDACAPPACVPTKDQPAGATCGGRISWLESGAGGRKSERSAKAEVSAQFPRVCGACKPAA